MITTVQQHILEMQQRVPGARGTFSWLLSGITLATKMTEAKIRRAGLSDLLGAAGAVNVQGEAQQKLDVYANQALLHCLGLRDSVAMLVSEENEEPVTFDRAPDTGEYVIVFDPLDGSSNIDVNINVGTIFSIYRAAEAHSDHRAHVLQRGSRQLAAGYVVYGPSTILVYTSGRGVFGFTLDPAIGAYVLSHDNIRMPERGNVYSVNEANSGDFPEPYRNYLALLRSGALGRKYTSRYVGSLVADFHRTLLKGGIFLYPPTKGYAQGKLRLLYEANPLAFIAEQANGLATDGEGRILDIEPYDIHQRTPFVIGSKEEIEAFMSEMKGISAALWWHSVQAVMGQHFPKLIAFTMLIAPLAIAGERTERSGVSFQTSDRCFACHNGLTTPSGEDVSIGIQWRSSIMANSSRDPYWQASVRRETIDHPEGRAYIEDDCGACHMPITRYKAKLRGKPGTIFSHLPFDDSVQGLEAEDGVTCSLCHQIMKDKLGTRESFNGDFVIHSAPSRDDHTEYGPFSIEQGNKLIMDSSTGGFIPNEQPHIRDSALCATCHTLYTKALGPGGKSVGELPEQVPYQEWLHSDYRDRYSCQDCHMPEVKEATQVARVLGPLRQGMHRHVFVAGNFLMIDMLNRFRGELSVAALPEEFTQESKRIVDFLQTRSARVSVGALDSTAPGHLRFDVSVENLNGHKLPTAYPSRRAWLHVTVRDRNGATVFESGAINPDGSIKGNDNDADPNKYEPHYREITSSDQVEIYESILGDPQNHVTTGLLTGVRYLKDNRLLPHGFDKQTATPDIAVMGDAATDPDFTDQGSRVAYSVSIGNGQGPFHVTAELWYQPIGFRWAHNLEPYRDAEEPRRFTDCFVAMQSRTAVILAQAER